MGKRENIRRAIKGAKLARRAAGYAVRGYGVDLGPAGARWVVDPLDEMMGPTARAREQAEAAARRSAIERGRVIFLDAADDMLEARADLIPLGGGNA